VETNWGLVFKLHKAPPAMVADKNTIKKNLNYVTSAICWKLLKKKKRA